MRRPRIIILIIITFIAFCANSYALQPGSSAPKKKASPALLNGNFGDKISFGNGCDGRTDIPHESHHVPLTVNVTALTECLNREVFITTTISRHGWWIFPDTKSVSAQGYQKVTVNVALPCKWKKGQPPILYVVKSMHRDSAGAQAPTGRSELIRC